MWLAHEVIRKFPLEARVCVIVQSPSTPGSMALARADLVPGWQGAGEGDGFSGAICSESRRRAGSDHSREMVEHALFTRTMSGMERVS